MSQTHLLLLVVAVIFVAIAIIVGTSAFTGGVTSANYDSLLNQATNIATQAQHWKSTPQILDGSPDALKGQRANFTGLDFPSMGLKPWNGNPLCHKSTVGQFALEIEPDGLWIIGASVSYQNRVAIRVTGNSTEMLSSTGEDDGDLMVVRGGYPVFVSTGGSSVRVGEPLTCGSSVAAVAGSEREQPGGEREHQSGPGHGDSSRFGSLLRLYFSGPIRAGFGGTDGGG